MTIAENQFAADAQASCALEPRIAVVIPCYNEAMVIAQVVADFRNAMPMAAIYVYDNNSADDTAEVARAAGAIVRHEPLQGKGNVIRRIFADVDADLYVLVDGDGTYPAEAAPVMVSKLLQERLDMVTGVRQSKIDAAYRRGHRTGNRLLTGIVARIFGDRASDMLSGYRVFSRRFVKSFPADASGFETETEFTIHALDLRLPIGDLDVAYRERPVGSSSKLRTYADGWRILRAILWLVKEERPLQVFSATACGLLLLSLGLGIPVVVTFMRTGLVPRIPTAVLATGLAILSFLVGTAGLILESVARGRRETRRLAYLAIPPPPEPASRASENSHLGKERVLQEAVNRSS